jgi:hypothetical protein
MENELGWRAGALTFFGALIVLTAAILVVGLQP